MTKKELQEYRWIKRNIQRLEDRLLELETEATKQTTQLTQDPISGSGYNKDRMTDVVAMIIPVRDRINQQLEKSYELVVKIEKAIETLPEREKYLVRARYIDGVAWERICVDMGYSWRQVHRIHSDALKMLA